MKKAVLFLCVAMVCFTMTGCYVTGANYCYHGYDYGYSRYYGRSYGGGYRYNGYDHYDGGCRGNCGGQWDNRRLQHGDPVPDWHRGGHSGGHRYR